LLTLGPALLLHLLLLRLAHGVRLHDLLTLSPPLLFHLLRLSRGVRLHGLLALSPPLLFHLLLRLSRGVRLSGLLTLGPALLFHLLLLCLARRLLSAGRCCLLLTFRPTLLLYLLPCLPRLSLRLSSGLRLLQRRSLLIAHELTHLAPSRLVALLRATRESSHPLRLFKRLRQAIGTAETCSFRRFVDL
jgi:hypothetical protein